MARYIFYAVLIYLLYRFIFDFLIPLRKTTRAMKEQFRQAQEQMNEQMNQNGYNQQQQPVKPEKQEKIGDYIDFEEVKK